MKYQTIILGRFVDRLNRFIVRVEINGKEEPVHIMKTGKCRELLISEAKVILTRSDNTRRKTGYDLIAVYKSALGLVNIDSLAPNHVMNEWLEELEFKS